MLRLSQALVIHVYMLYFRFLLQNVMIQLLKVPGLLAQKTTPNEIIIL